MGTLTELIKGKVINCRTEEEALIAGINDSLDII